MEEINESPRRNARYWYFPSLSSVNLGNIPAAGGQGLGLSSRPPQGKLYSSFAVDINTVLLIKAI